MSDTSMISMQASRCPDATVQMRQLVRLFAAHPEVKTLELETIEPSLRRSLPAFIAAEELAIEVTPLADRAITEQDLAQWATQFDEDDYSDVAVVQRFMLKK